MAIYFTLVWSHGNRSHLLVISCQDISPIRDLMVIYLIHMWSHAVISHPYMWSHCKTSIPHVILSEETSPTCDLLVRYITHMCSHEERSHPNVMSWQEISSIWDLMARYLIHMGSHGEWSHAGRSHPYVIPLWDISPRVISWWEISPTCDLVAWYIPYMGTGDGRFPSSGVFQELIQNAEEAGARTVTFLYDLHAYGTKSLPHPDLATFQVRHLTWTIKWNIIHYIYVNWCDHGLDEWSESR